MEVDDDKVIDALGSALRYGGAALADVPDLLKRLLTTGSWRDFTTQRREHVHHERFADFVTAAPLAGLGSTVGLVERVVADDDEATRLLRKALKSQGRRSDIRHNRTEVRTGTTRAYALERLQRDAPELHAQVLAGELSPHAAMVTAGFRRRTITVPVDSPESIAATLRRQLDPEQLSTLVRLLGADA